MAGTVVVTGVPGVGASQVCQQARRDLGEAYTLVNFGDVMLEEALEHGLADSRADLAELPLRDQRLLQRRAGEYVARKAVEGPLLVNTHLVVHTAYGFVPGLPEAVQADLDPTVFVVVDAPVETIRHRREATDRTYPNEARSAVAFHRQLQNAAVFAYASATGAPVRHVSNDQRVEAAADDLAAVAEVMAPP